jgi:hypothetical protein
MSGIHAAGVFLDAFGLVAGGGDDGGLEDERRHGISLERLYKLRTSNVELRKTERRWRLLYKSGFQT